MFFNNVQSYIPLVEQPLLRSTVTEKGTMRGHTWGSILWSNIYMCTASNNKQNYQQNSALTSRGGLGNIINGNNKMITCANNAGRYIQTISAVVFFCFRFVCPSISRFPGNKSKRREIYKKSYDLFASPWSGAPSVSYKDSKVRLIMVSFQCVPFGWFTLLFWMGPIATAWVQGCTFNYSI